MGRRITQRELKNETGKIERRRLVPREELVALFRGSPHVDFKRFRKDIDALIEQDPRPRADRGGR